MNRKIISSVKDVLVIPLTKLFKKYIQEQNSPSSFKIAKIITTFKSRDSNNTTNYRSISLIPTIDKIFETFLKNQLNSCFEKHNIFQADLISRFQFVSAKHFNSDMLAHLVSKTHFFLIISMICQMQYKRVKLCSLLTTSVMSQVTRIWSY